MEKEARLKENKAARPENRTGKKPARAYLLMKFDDSADLLEVYRRFQLTDHVSDCVATRGDFDLILILEADTFEAINEVVENKIMTVQGLIEAALMPVESPPAIGGANGKIGGKRETADDHGRGENTSSYVFLEMETDRLPSIWPALHATDRIASPDCIKGKFNVAMRVHGASYAEIDRTIRNKIRPLAGVLRIKELPTIRLSGIQV